MIESKSTKPEVTDQEENKMDEVEETPKVVELERAKKDDEENPRIPDAAEIAAGKGKKAEAPKEEMSQEMPTIPESAKNPESTANPEEGEPILKTATDVKKKKKKKVIKKKKKKEEEEEELEPPEIVSFLKNLVCKNSFIK